MDTARKHPEVSDYYYLSNDGIDLDPLRQVSGDVTLVGVANPDVLHLLAGFVSGAASLKDCIVFDNNPRQLAHLQRLFDLIAQSTSRLDFIERLFCIKLGKNARSALLDFRPADPWRVAGAEAGAGHAEVEHAVWRDAQFDDTLFHQQAGIRATKTGSGLALYSNVVGGMMSQILTLICIDTAKYEATPFSVRFGFGYLADEEVFAKVRELLKSLTPRCVLTDASQGLTDILLAHRYERLCLWASNIFTPYFIDRHPPLHAAAQAIRSLATRTKDLPQIDLSVVSDSRIPGPLTGLKWRSWLGRWFMTPHYKSFSVVRRWLLTGRTLEVVNVARWIEEDGGRSKLPNAEYRLLSDFLHEEPEVPRQHDTIFLHALLGHGATDSELVAAFDMARMAARRVLVLEHNPQSLDFLGNSAIRSLQDPVALLGSPSGCIAVPGRWSRARNRLLVYDDASLPVSGVEP